MSGGEILWLGTLPPSPIRMVYTVQVPAAVTGAQQIRGEVEYQFASMVNPAIRFADPNPLTMDSLPGSTNRAPVLIVPPNQTVDELSTLTATNTATDPDLPANTLTFSLVSGPAGLSVNPASGVLTWRPTEAQGPGTNVVTVRVTDNGVPSLSDTKSFTVVVREVNTAPVLRVPTNQTVTAMTTLQVTNTATDADLPANTLTFSVVSGPTGASLNPTTGVLIWTPTGAQAPGTNIITVKVTDNGVPPLSDTKSFTVVVNSVGVMPNITQQPLSQTVAPSTNVTFSVTATGTAPLNYQWRKDGTNLLNGGQISGVTTTVITISNVQAANAGNYQVIVANAAGSVTSAVATLTVRVPPAITVQPQSRTNLLGTTATFNVTASGTEPLSYQWRFNGLNLADGARISGAASRSLALSSVQTNDAGSYTVLITNAFGTVTSQVAVLSILARALPMGRVVHWGSTNHGEGNVPAGLTNAVAIGAGDDYGLAVKADGTVAAWGESADPFGQTIVPVGLSGVIAVAGASMHSLALKADGTVVAWGGHQFGQTNVPSGLNNVVAVSARGSFSLALRANGTVAAWGYDADGQNAPPAGLSNVVAVATGGQISLALKADGTVVAWGYNDRGQINPPAGLTNVVAIAAGCQHFLALLNNGTVIAWGSNDYGQTHPPNSLSNVVAIAAGVYHNLALKHDGTVVCWGDGLGGNTIPPPGLSNVIAIAAGFSSFALVTGADPSIALQPQSRTNIAGTAATFSVTVTGTTPLGYQWLKNGVNLANGGNVSGATSASLILANVQPMDAANYQVVVTNAAGSVTSAVATLTVLVPPAITGQPQSRTNMAGTTATFSVTATGTDPLSYQWRKGGVNLADGGRLSGATTAALTLAFVQAADAGNYTVVVSNTGGSLTSQVAVLTVTAQGPLAEGFVVAWGNNNWGQTDVPADLSNVVAIAAGLSHSLALKRDGTVIGWGQGSLGQTNSPAGLSGVAGIAAGRAHSLALKSDGTVVGWGDNGLGQTKPPVGLSNVRAVAAGSFHSLALKGDGTVVAWGGSPMFGQTNIPTGLSGVVAIGAGIYASLALRGDGTIVGWGYSPNGTTSIPAGLSNVVAIAVGNEHGLALKRDGTVIGWGYNGSGQTNVPAGLNGVVAIAAGANHSLALKSDGTLIGWGSLTNIPVGLGNGNVLAIAAGGGHSLALRSPDILAITLQPASQTVATGANAMLSVVTIGTGPLSHQWRKNGITLTDGGNVSGATTPILTLTSVQAGDAGSYQVTVTNPFSSVTSQIATLTLGTMPAGTKRWEFYDPSLGGASSPAIGPDWTVYVPGSGVLYALDGATGAQRWRRAAGAGNGSPPAMGADGRVYLAFDNRRVYAMNGVTGNILWEYIINEVGSHISSTPAIGPDGTLYIGSEPHLFALDGATGAERWVFIDDNGNARYIWSSPAIAADGTLYFGTYSAMLCALDRATGARRWQFYAGAQIYSSPAIGADGTIYFGCTFRSSVFAVNGATGAKKWEVPTGGYVFSSPAIAPDGTVYIGSDDSKVYALDGNTGAKRWEFTTAGAVRSSPAIGADGTVYIGSADGKLYALDGATGVKRWEFAAGGDAGGAPVLGNDGTLYIGANNRVYALWTTSAGGLANSPWPMFHQNARHTGRVEASVPAVPVLTLQPPNRRTPVERTVTFSVAAFGTTPFSYQWLKNGVNLANGGDVSGVASPTLTLADVQTNDAGGYQVIVMNSLGSVTSRVAQLTVFTPSPPVAGAVVAWGNNRCGEASPPAGLSNVVAMAAGRQFNLVLNADGTMVGWGDNTYGQRSVPKGLSNLVAITAGSYHALALRKDGTVVGWGDNGNGQASPPNGLRDVVALAGGTFHSLALGSDGRIVSWGPSDYTQDHGQTRFPAGLSEVVAIAAGMYHSLALKSDGTVLACGENYWGQASPPVSLGHVVAIAAGSAHSLALKNDGTVAAWGHNGYGQTNLPAGLSNVVAIDAGDNYSLALRADGTLVGWGFNPYGQAGSPVGLSNVVAIAGGGTHSLALMSAGTLTITVQPASQSVGTGANVTFSVAAVGTSSLSYQWRKGASALLDSGNVSGATTATLTLANVQPGDAGQYSVVVRDTTNGSIVSQTATLSVSTPPTICVERFNTDVTGTAQTRAAYPRFSYSGTASLSVSNGVLMLRNTDANAMLMSGYPGDLLIDVDMGAPIGGGTACGFKVNFVVGDNLVGFHPGCSGGQFQVDGPYGFGDQNMGFTPALGVLHHLTLKITAVTGLFEITLRDGSNPANIYTRSFTNPGYVAGCALGFGGPHSNGATLIYDNLVIRRLSDAGTSTLAGVGLDGYVAHATVFFDANRNGEQDGNEPGTITDDQGQFALQVPLGEFDTNHNGRLDPTEGCLVLKGGLDIATGQPLRTALTAPPGSTVVSSLTTLLQELLDQTPGLSVLNAQERVQEALGVSNRVDLTSYDAFAGARANDPLAVAVLRAAAQVQDTTVQIAALMEGALNNQNSEQLARLVTSALAVQLQTNASFSISAPSQIQNVLTQAASHADIHLSTDIAAGAAQIIAEVNQLKDQAAAAAMNGLSAAKEISRIQGLAQGSIADDLALVAANAKAIDDALAANTGEALQTQVTAAPVGDITGDETRLGTFSFSQSEFRVLEDGAALSAVTVVRAEGNKGPVGLRITLSDGTARYEDGDYSTTNIDLQFADGQISRTVDLASTLIDDNQVETNETIHLTLSLLPGAPPQTQIGTQNQAVVTIIDNDSPGVFAFTEASYRVKEDGTTVNPVMIRRDGGSAGEVTLVITPTEILGGATAHADFDPTPVTVTFRPGNMNRIVTIPVVADSLLEGDEPLQLSLILAAGSPPGARMGQQTSAILTILDSTTTLPHVKLGILSVGPGGEFRFSLTGTSGQGCTVQHSTNLVDWADLSMHLLSETPVVITGAQTQSAAQRFYRAVLLP